MKIARDDDMIGRMVMTGGREWVIQHTTWNGFVGDHVLTLERADHFSARRAAIWAGRDIPRLRVVFATAADCMEC